MRLSRLARLARLRVPVVPMRPLATAGQQQQQVVPQPAPEQKPQPRGDGPGLAGLVAAAVKKVTRTVLDVAARPPSPAAPVETWAQAVAHAEQLVSPGAATASVKLDPRVLVGEDLAMLTRNIKKLVGSGHPLLTTISSYYFEQGGKHFRPLIVLLMSRALAPQQADVSPSQRRLAEITEMIHTASLLHDDVIDLADTRRNQPSANVHFGNKLAVLAGDFLLAKASMALAQLKNVEVVELLAVVIANLVEGEFMQMRAERDKAMSFEYYMQKTYLKTATLIARSCEAAAMLAGSTPAYREAAYDYGRNLGLAFQLVDDLLDFTGNAETLGAVAQIEMLAQLNARALTGKPAAADLTLGLATAPVLFAAERFPELVEPIRRQFSRAGDVELARELVLRSDGLERTRAMALEHCRLATEAALRLPDSPARAALVQLTDKVVQRDK